MIGTKNTARHARWSDKNGKVLQSPARQWFRSDKGGTRTAAARSTGRVAVWMNGSLCNSKCQG